MIAPMIAAPKYDRAFGDPVRYARPANTRPSTLNRGRIVPRSFSCMAIMEDSTLACASSGTRAQKQSAMIDSTHKLNFIYPLALIEERFRLGIMSLCNLSDTSRCPLGFLTRKKTHEHMRRQVWETHVKMSADVVHQFRKSNRILKDDLAFGVLSYL